MEKDKIWDKFQIMNESQKRSFLKELGFSDNEIFVLLILSNIPSNDFRKLLTEPDEFIKEIEERQERIRANYNFKKVTEFRNNNNKGTDQEIANELFSSMKNWFNEMTIMEFDRLTISPIFLAANIDYLCVEWLSDCLAAFYDTEDSERAFKALWIIEEYLKIPGYKIKFRLSDCDYENDSLNNIMRVANHRIMLIYCMLTSNGYVFNKQKTEEIMNYSLDKKFYRHLDEIGEVYYKYYK